MIVIVVLNIQSYYILATIPALAAKKIENHMKWLVPWEYRGALIPAKGRLHRRIASKKSDFCLALRSTCTTFAPLKTHRSGCSAVRLARLLWEQEVPGSNPGTPTTNIERWLIAGYALVSQRSCFDPFSRITACNTQGQGLLWWPCPDVLARCAVVGGCAFIDSTRRRAGSR